MDFTNFNGLKTDEKVHAYVDRVKKREQNWTEQARIEFERSAAGQQLAEFRELRKDFDEYKREQQAADIANKKHARIERKWNLVISLTSGVVSGLLVHYWPQIVTLFSH